MNTLNVIAAIAAIVGVVPLIFWVYKKLIKKVVKPVTITLSEGVVSRGDGDDFVGFRAKLIITSNNHGSNTVHDFYPLFVIAEHYHPVKDVFINGEKLSNAGQTMMFRAFEVNDKDVVITLNGAYDVDRVSNFKQDLRLELQYSVDNRRYEEKFGLTYMFLGSF